MLPVEPMSLLTKTVVLVLFGSALFLMLQLNRYFRELMRHFTLGDVFSQAAITNVKHTLKSGVFLVVMAIVQHLVAWGCSHAPYFHVALLWDLAVAGLFFGLMYTLLWALEIGVDLNEESEKTI